MDIADGPKDARTRSSEYLPSGVNFGQTVVVADGPVGFCVRLYQNE